MPEFFAPAAVVTALIKHGFARIASAFLCVLGGTLIGHDANTRPEPNKIILEWVSTILETFGAIALIVLSIVSQHPISEKGKASPPMKPSKNKDKPAK